MIDTVVDAKDFRRVITVLKNTDKDLVTRLKKDMRDDVKPYAAQVAQAVPAQAPLSGMELGYSKYRWAGVLAKVSFTPGKRRRARAGESALLSIAVTSKDPASRGLYFAELAGTRTNGSTAQGTHAISVLKQRFANPNKKGGRFAWKTFYAFKPQLVSIGEKSVQAFGDEVSKVI